MPSAQEIIASLGQDKDDKNKTRCPVCGAAMSVDEKEGKILLSCWGSGDKEHRNEIIKNLASRGLWPESEYKPERKNGTAGTKTLLAGPALNPDQEKPYRPQDDKDEIPKDKFLPWKKGTGDEDKLGPFISYMKSRGLHYQAGKNIPACVRYSTYPDKKTGEQVHALVFSATTPDDDGVHAANRLFIEKDEKTGEWKKTGSKMLGVCKGRGVWIDRKKSHKIVAVGEGIETTLSVRELFSEISCCAALSTTGMDNLFFQDETETLYILVDSDQASTNPAKWGWQGQRHAIKLAKRFEASRPGRVAWLVSPDDSCFSDAPVKKDFNDLTAPQILEQFNKKTLLADLAYIPPDPKTKKKDDTGSSADGGNADSYYTDQTLFQLNEFNNRYAAVLLGSDFRIVEEDFDEQAKRHTVVFLRKDSFFSYHAPKKGFIKMENGIEMRPAAKLWMDWPNRRTYNKVAFDPTGNTSPGVYNMFRGFPYQPKKGDWSLMRKHMLEIICAGNQEHFEYLLAWMARIVQDPGGRRPGVAVVLKGGKGVGKGIFAGYFGAIFGEAFLPIADPESFTGRFNMHLSKSIVVFLDEAVWGGDKKAEGKLKQLITEPTILFEPKGIDSITMSNFINAIIASNEDWIVPATGDERRFFVLYPSDAKQQDTVYFGKIVKERDNGGIEAMMFDLLAHDFSHINLRKAPQTEGLRDQVAQSLDNVLEFWHITLSRGFLLSADNGAPANTTFPTTDTSEFWPLEVWKHEIYDEYQRWCKKKNEHYIENEHSFWRKTWEIWPGGGKAKENRKKIDGKRNFTLILKKIEEHRKAFSLVTKIDFTDDYQQEEAPF